MQENALHGWRLSDSRNMRMTGYPAKTRSLSWSHDGQWLATSGADAAVVWPFKDKDGPMGKAPRECGVRAARVTQVAFHPKALVVAIGYADGLVCCAASPTRRKFWCAIPATARSARSRWDATGARLLFGLESGAAGLLACRLITAIPHRGLCHHLKLADRGATDGSSSRISARRSGPSRIGTSEASAALLANGDGTGESSFDGQIFATQR